MERRLSAETRKARAAVNTDLKESREVKRTRRRQINWWIRSCELCQPPSELCLRQRWNPFSDTTVIVSLLLPSCLFIFFPPYSPFCHVIIRFISRRRPESLSYMQNAKSSRLHRSQIQLFKLAGAKRPNKSIYNPASAELVGSQRSSSVHHPCISNA